MEFKWPLLLMATLLALAGFVTGCETPAHQLDPRAANFIQPGVTTRAEVEKAYGQPNQVIQAGNGRTLLVWQLIYWPAPLQHSYGQMDDGTARALSVLVDTNNRVVKKLSSDHAFRILAQAGGVMVGEEMPAEVLERIKVHETTRAQVIAMLGEPMMETLSTGGNQVLDWAYAAGNYMAGETQRRQLRVIFGTDDVVKSVHTINAR